MKDYNVGYTDGGRNPYYEGLFDGETEDDKENRITQAVTEDQLPRPTYHERDGESCGECHLAPGERCDVCGIRQVAEQG